MYLLKSYIITLFAMQLYSLPMMIEVQSSVPLLFFRIDACLPLN